MIMPLQKPHPTAKMKESINHLQRRMALWGKGGPIDKLLMEGCVIQHQIFKKKRLEKENSAENRPRLFAKMMMAGKVKDAIRFLTQSNSNDIIPISEESLQELKKKHPPREPPIKSALMMPNEPIQEPHSIIFDQLNGELIRKVALRTEGSAGPSGLDASAWRRLCTSFAHNSSDLCEALACTAKRICCSFVDPVFISSFVACHLIALDKHPGIRPIGIGEISRRIVGKAILLITRDDAQEATGALQLCAGQEAGCEAAIHAIHQLFELSDTDAAILIDATNAFNSLNRENALRNIQYLCPSISIALINTYRENVSLFIDGHTLSSTEGTTQGDPLAMAMYALGVLPLIHSLSTNAIKQVWYADDATASGELSKIRSWWEHLVEIGPQYGYFPNASKTWMIVKKEKFEEAQVVFDGTGVNVTQEKVLEWTKEIEVLSTFAVSQPHASYAACYTHGLSSKWTFLCRTIPNISKHLRPLEEAIRYKFLPAITGQSALSDVERDLLALPSRLGGLGIINPVTSSDIQHLTSINISTPLTSLILQ